MENFDHKEIEKKIIEAKKKLKTLSSDHKKNFINIEKNITIEVEEIEQCVANNKEVIPELDYHQLVSNAVDKNLVNLIKKRGCVIIRNVFDKKQIEFWNDELVKYIEHNNYYEDQKEKAGLDQYFSDLKSGKPQIFGLYWSKPQIEIRQSEKMAKIKSWLNHLWTFDFGEKQIFNPNLDLVYADRVRRREPGDSTLGLSPHCDAGSVERWIDDAFQKIYYPIFSDKFQSYNPFNANYRTETKEIPSPAVSHVFRTFQGWTALTQQGPKDGTLKLIPSSKSIAYVLTRALQDDVPIESLCGSMPGRALSINSDYHALLLRALVSIPIVHPGDTVWWHPDVGHAVEDQHEGKEYSNVIYIGAVPYCNKNFKYAKEQAVNFLKGKSPPDFAAEDYEVNYKGRATINDLTELGKQQMAL